MSRRSLPPLPNSLMRLNDADFVRLQAKKGRSLWASPSKDCPTCDDTKVFLARTSDGVFEYDCNCKEQYKLHLVMLHSGIEKQYQKISWDDVSDISREASDQSSAYLDNARVEVSKGRGLTLWSEGNGTGKTMMASLILKALLASGYDVYFTLFSSMMDDYTAGWRDMEEKAWFERRVKNTQVLLIDDVGSEMHRGVKESVHAVETMFKTVVRERNYADMPTLITTNLTPAQMGAYGDSVLSLLSMRNQPIHVTGKDFRPSQKEREERDIHAGISRPFLLRNL